MYRYLVYFVRLINYLNSSHNIKIRKLKKRYSAFFLCVLVVELIQLVIVEVMNCNISFECLVV